MPATPAPAAAAPAAAVAGLLAMQEAALHQVADREARRHGQALLAALAEMQRALLSGSAAGLHRLATLVRTAPPAQDPALAAVQRALLVRAAVELAAGRSPDRGRGIATRNVLPQQFGDTCNMGLGVQGGPGYKPPQLTLA